VAGVLATVITADIDAMCRRLANICHLHDATPEVRDVIWGIHIEGPFLSERPATSAPTPPRVRARRISIRCASCWTRRTD
jgi:N-acetylglucosamine-6-phosphate deacetylase